MPGLESLPLSAALAIIVVIVIAGLVQGAIGFGFPFIATPLIALMTDMRTAVVSVLVPTLCVTIVNIMKSGPLLPVLRRFWVLPLFAIAGSTLGTMLFVAAPHVPYSLLLGLLTLGYLNLDRLGLGQLPVVKRHERVFAPVAGLMAGVFEGTVNVAAPPLIIFYLSLGLAPATLVQALNICFAVGKATQWSVLTVQGGVSLAVWLATLPLAAIGTAGLLIGVRVRNRIAADTFRIWVKRFLLLIAVILLAQYAWQQFR